MFKRWRLVLRGGGRLFLVGAAVTYSALAPALGLGEITLHSALNQPLRAEIALVDASGLEEGDLSVRLATEDEFSRAGVDRAPFLHHLTFTPVLRGNRSLIQVTSSKPVNEPFLDFLVQLDQPNGRLVREYTVLIDPPGSPEIVPATDEPVFSPSSSAFPRVEPSVVAPLATKTPSLKTEPASFVSEPETGPAAEQLAASVLQNRQLQTTVDELTAKLQRQDKEIAVQQKQLAEQQSQLLALKSLQAEPVPLNPDALEEPGTDWLQAARYPMMAALLVLGWLMLRQRRRAQSEPEGAMDELRGQEPVMQSTPVHYESPADQEHQQLTYFSPATETTMAAAAPPEDVPDDTSRLNIDQLTMDSSWELINPYANAKPVTLSEHEATMEWVLEADPQPRDDLKRSAPELQAGLS
ncbi:FimV family protein [Pseudomonas sp. C32]|uniref:type IV pilus assembly protein FimV n=1 Tax=Pseudomonas sp. C32 TaxID=1529208 RepID=UPI00262AAB1E|nr:hypothetical protein [Pseudomonas sp. C32]MDN4544987.1 hypothetical protein [Pseudomonas sp. C32]